MAKIEYLDEDGLKELIRLIQESCKCGGGTTTETEPGPEEITYEFDSPKVTATYSDLPNKVGEKIEPQLVVSQVRRGSDGSVNTLYLEDGGYEKSFNAYDSGGLQNATLDGTTGVITCTALNEEEQRIVIGVVNVNVTANGKSGSAKVNVYQSVYEVPETVTYEYGNPVVTFGYGGQLPSEVGATLNPTLTVTQTRSGSDGSEETLHLSAGEYEALYSTSGLENAELDTTSGMITCTAENGSNEQIQIGTVSVVIVANGKTGTATGAVYQSGSGEVTYEYGTPTVKVTYDTLPNEVGATIEPRNWYVTQTKTGSDGSSESLILTDGFEKSFSAYDSGGLQNATLDETTGVITCTDLNEKEEEIVLGVVTVRVVANGKSGSTKVNIYQEAYQATPPEPDPEPSPGPDDEEYEDPVVNIEYEDVLPNVIGATITPLLAVTQVHKVGDAEYKIPLDDGEYTKVFEVKDADGLVNAELNAETGAVTCTSLNEAADELNIGVVKVTVTANDKSGSGEAGVRQEKGDTAVTYEYDNPKVTATYSDLPNKVGEKIEPQLVVSQVRRGSDGSVNTLYLEDGGYEKSFNAYDSGGLQNAELNEETGVITCTALNEEAEEIVIGVVTVTITANGVSGSTKVNIYQEAYQATPPEPDPEPSPGPDDEEYGDPVVNIEYEDVLPNVIGATITPLLAVTQVHKVGDDEYKIPLDDGEYTKVFEVKDADGLVNAELNAETGAVTCTSLNEAADELNIGVVKVTVTANDKSGSGEAGVRQEKGDTAVTYEYGIPTVYVTYDTLPNVIGGSIRPRNLMITQTRTGSDGSSVTMHLSEGFDVNYNAIDSGGLQNAELNEETGVITCTALNEEAEEIVLGVVNVNVVANGKSGSTKVNIYQEAYQATPPEPDPEPSPGPDDEEYEDPVVNIEYEDVLPNVIGATITPLLAVTQVHKVGDAEYKIPLDDGEYTKVFEVKDADGLVNAELNAETGAVTCTSLNGTTDELNIGVVKVTVTANGKSGSGEAEVRQEKGDTGVTYEYGIPTVYVTYDTLPNVIGGSIRPRNLMITQTRTGSDGSSVTIHLSEGFEKSFNATDSNGLLNAELNEETGVITCTALNEEAEEIEIGVVNVNVVANGKSGSTKINIYQEAAEVPGVVTVTYEKPTITKFSYGDIPAEGGTATPTIEFTQDWHDSEGNSGTLTQESTGYEVTFVPLCVNYGASMSSTGAITLSAENETTERRLVADLQVWVTANGRDSDTLSHSIYQEGAELKYTYSSPSITINYPDLPNEVGATVSPDVLVVQSVTGNDGSHRSLYLSASDCDEVSYNAYDSGGLTNAELNEETGVITCTDTNDTTARLVLGVVNINVTVNGMSASNKVSPCQLPNDDIEYGDITITKFEYDNIPAEGGSVRPTVEFTQTATDAEGNETVLTQATTDYVAVFACQETNSTGATIDPATGEVATDSANYGTEQRNVTMAVVRIIANGVTSPSSYRVVRQEGGAVMQYNAPEVTLGDSLYVEESGSSSKKVYFNIGVKYNDASIVSPSHFGIGGEEYYVEFESAVHRNDAGQEVTTGYVVDVPATSQSSWGSYLVSAYEIHSSDGDVNGDVNSTNMLVWNGTDMSVR